MKIRTALLALLSPATLFAQRAVSIRPQRASTDAVVSQMFRLDPRAAAHSLTAYLPGDALLTIESQGVSYWPAQTELARITSLAAGAVRGVQDSFRSATSEKCVAVNLPIAGAPQTVQYTENFSSANLVVRSGGAQAALKAGFDTVRILQTYGMKQRKKDSARPQQIQYTFVVKSLADFDGIAANEALLSDVSRTMDSVVAVRRKRWGRDDAWYHSIEAVYRPGTATEDDARLKVQRGYDQKGNRGVLKGIEGAIGIDVTLLRNTLMPGLTCGVGYRWPRRSNADEFRFVRLSNTTLAQFRQFTYMGSEEFWLTESTNFVNLEFGTVFNRPNTLLPLYRTSFGFGWAYIAVDGSNLSTTPKTSPPLSQGTVRLFLTYSASKLVSIVPQMFVGGNTGGFPYSLTVRVGI